MLVAFHCLSFSLRASGCTLVLLAFVSLGFGVICQQKWRKAKASRKQRSRQGQGQGDLAHAPYYIGGCEDEVIKLQSDTHKQKEQINRKEMAASIAGTTNILLNKTLSLSLQTQVLGFPLDSEPN